MRASVKVRIMRALLASALSVPFLVAASISQVIAAPGQYYLTEDESIGPDGVVVARNGQFILMMREDGNAVLYKENQRVLWQSGTHVRNSILRMQKDGNLVVIAPGNKPIWATGTAGRRGSRLEVQDDGNMVVYASGHVAVWATGVPRPTPGRPQTSLDKAKVADYALRYSLKGNSSYRSYPKDCTNFVSQAVRAGGWSFVGGDALAPKHRTDPSKWYYHKDDLGRTTRSWTEAQNWYQFTQSSRRTVILDSEFDLEVGDVLQVDFENDGRLDHSMVVTAIGPVGGVSLFTEPYLSYHTTNKKNIGLSEFRRMTASDYKSARYVAHRT